MVCPTCQKTVVVIGISPGAAAGDELESIHRDLEREGKLALFNPPPFGPYACPVCGSQLDDAKVANTA